jgi:high-affinity iron transporter
LVAATGVGLLLFRWGVKVNLKQFFQSMGVALLLIVGGLVIAAFRHLDMAANAYTQLNPSVNLCLYSNHSAESASCILGPLLWDLSTVLSDRAFPGIVLKTLLGYRDHLYVLQAGSYLLFGLIVGSLYFRSLSSGPSRVTKGHQPIS